jgi:phosphomannomutase
MPEELIITVSGLRGIVGENLTSAVAVDYGCAFGAYIKSIHGDKKRWLSVCIGRDSRPSGEMLKSAVATGLCAVGINAIDLGIVSTPGVGIMVRELQCDGGIIVTASHNPVQYNGIKLLLDDGIAPSADAIEQIKQYFFDKNFSFVDSAKSGKVVSNDQTHKTHIAKVLAIVDKEAIVARRFKVVLDSVNGAGGPVTKMMLAALGCQVDGIHDEPTGLFAHKPEPTAKNLTGLCEEVKAKHAQIGFAQDPDADRLAVVDENGTYIGEEYSLALVAKYIFSKKTGKAATNLSTSKMIDDIAEEAGGLVIRTPVGEANVAAEMVENNCIIGGEGNGGVIDLRVGPVRDSLVAIALILQLMAESGKSVGQLTREIPSYYMLKEKIITGPKEARYVLDSAKKHFADAKLDTTDGCRFDFEDGWLHLRVSNTEPAMRIIAEAKDQAVAQKYIDTVLNIQKERTS